MLESLEQKVVSGANVRLVRYVSSHGNLKKMELRHEGYHGSGRSWGTCYVNWRNVAGHGASVKHAAAVV